MDRTQKTITAVEILGVPAGLQLLRIGIKTVVFTWVERSIWTDTLVSCLYMAVMSAVMLVWWKHKDKQWKLFPEQFNWKYMLSTVLAAAFLISTPLITQNLSPQALLSLTYGAVITVVFEEVVFRGWVWRKLEILHSNRAAYIFSSLLFGLWHLGYADTVLWRTALFFPQSDVASILFWKVVTGLALGLVFGFLRYKCGNVYASMLAHGVINAFGS